MEKDPGRISDGFVSLERGVDSWKNPSQLSRNQGAYAENVTVRGGSPQNRPGYFRMKLEGTPLEAFATGKFQGGEFYEDPNNRGALIAQSGGLLYRFDFKTSPIALTVTDISVSGDPNPSIIGQCFLTQGEQYMIVQDGQSRPVIYDGATSRRAADDEIPVGSGPMAYGMGRFWVAQGRNYVAGDILGGDTGILKFTENDYLAEGGTFTVPLQSGQITAMRFRASPNTALGQGELMIVTPDAVFSNSVPIDRDEWKNLTDPAQRIVLNSKGGLSQASTVLVNEDVFMRSRDGIRSFIAAVREFNQWGNVPISREMDRVLKHDTDFLLPFASAILFDNRLLMTAIPVPLSNRAYFNGIVALDFDLISTMSERTPPAYDGVWTGLQVYRLIKGRFNGQERAFAFCRSQTNGFLDSIISTDVGSGFFEMPLISINGGGGTGATAVALMGVKTATITSAGTGHAAGDVITITNTGATFTESVKIKVLTVGGGGSIATVSIFRAGSYTAFPTNFIAAVTQASTTGAGTGATFGLNWGLMGAAVTDKGQNYTSRPDVLITNNEEASAAPAALVAVLAFRTELWEITRDKRFDYDLNSDGDPVESKITSLMELPSYDFQDGSRVKQLKSANIWVDRVAGLVQFNLDFKPDQYPCWVDWFDWSINASYRDTDTGDLCDPDVADPKTFSEQYRPKMHVPAPPDTAEAGLDKPARSGFEFQPRLQWTGFCRIKKIRVNAIEVVEDSEGPPVEASETQTGIQCSCP